VILALDPVGWAHVAKALAEHVRWARANGVRVPEDVLRLADLASTSASGRQDTSKSTGWAGLATTGPVEPSLLNYNEAAAVLGMGRRSLERLVEAGSLPRVRIGAAVRIRRQDLDEYVEALGGASEARSA